MLHKEKILDTQNFADLIQVSSKIILEANPVGATQMGIISYNNLWPDISPYGVKRDIEIMQSIQSKLKELEARISTEEEEDYNLLCWYTEINLLELQRFEFWKSACYLSATILGGINSLVMKKEPNKQLRAQSIVARLGSVRTMMLGEQQRLTNPIQIWIDVEVQSIDGLILFLKTLSSLFEDIDEVTQEELEIAIAQVETQLRDHQKWLRGLDGATELRSNSEAYHQLIAKRKLGLDVAELEELGIHYLQWTTDQLTEIANKLGRTDIDQLRREIRADHAPNFDAVVENYKKLAQKARKFIIDQDLLTLPQENLKVIFTPPPLRNILSIAAAGTPGRYDRDQTGYFFCTPHSDEQMLEEHSYAYQPLLISHESYPGHHVHGACKNQHPSEVRTSIFSHPSANTGFMYSSKLADITEGWGLYCEGMMYNHGFENDPDDPDLEQLFLQINAMRWRAARIVIDTRLHTGRMSYQEAVDYLIEQTGYHETTAKAEVMMYSRSPGYFSSYLLGKHLLTELKAELDGKISEKEFHDTILYAGNVPFWFIREKLTTSSVE